MIKYLIHFTSKCDFTFEENKKVAHSIVFKI